MPSVQCTLCTYRQCSHFQNILELNFWARENVFIRKSDFIEEITLELKVLEKMPKLSCRDFCHTFNSRVLRMTARHYPRSILPDKKLGLLYL